MIGGRIMAWLQQLCPTSDARRQLNAVLADTLAATRDASEAACDLEASARRDRIRTKWVARQIERRAREAAARKRSRQSVVIEGGVEAMFGGMLSEVGRSRSHDGRH